MATYSATFKALALPAQRSILITALLSAVRPHHWPKNLLVFVPMLAGHRFSIENIQAASLAFVCFSAGASSAYLANDVMDTAFDRAHVRKQRRSIAAGIVTKRRALWTSGILAVAGLTAAWLLSHRFCSVLAAYLVISLAYSAFLKRQPVADLLILASLFTIRVVGGGEATGITISKWLLTFSCFAFLTLAITKRCSEVSLTKISGRVKLLGRGYTIRDLPFLSALGAAAAIGTVLVLALYLSSPEVQLLYSHADRLWLATPLVAYWLCRVLLLSVRGVIHDDPLIFAMTDGVTWLTAGSIALIALAAV